jgi:hypothetical protein
MSALVEWSRCPPRRAGNADPSRSSPGRSSARAGVSLPHEHNPSRQYLRLEARCLEGLLATCLRRPQAGGCSVIVPQPLCDCHGPEFKRAALGWSKPPSGRTSTRPAPSPTPSRDGPSSRGCSWSSPAFSPSSGSTPRNRVVAAARWRCWRSGSPSGERRERAVKLRPPYLEPGCSSLTSPGRSRRLHEQQRNAEHNAVLSFRYGARDYKGHQTLRPCQGRAPLHLDGRARRALLPVAPAFDSPRHAPRGWRHPPPEQSGHIQYRPPRRGGEGYD